MSHSSQFLYYLMWMNILDFHKYFDVLEQWFSTSVPQEFFNFFYFSLNARIFKTCNTWLVKSTDLFFLRLSNFLNDTNNTTITIRCEWIKIITIFVKAAKIYFGVRWRTLVISLYMPGDEKGKKLLSLEAWFASVCVWVCVCWGGGREENSWNKQNLHIKILKLYSQ